MNWKNKHFSVTVRFWKHENLLDFGFRKTNKKFEKIVIDINPNNLIKFIEHSYSYIKISLSL